MTGTVSGGLLRLNPAMRRHVVVGLAALAAALIVFWLLEFSTETWGNEAGRKADGTLWRYNVATGSVALALMVATLAFGPIRKLRGIDRLAVHLPWRRVTGVWAAILALAHFPGGLAIHTSGWRLWRPFVSVLPGVPSRPFDAFTVGYWLGVFAFVTLVPLAVTSNNASLRRLGAARWKRLHRLAYLALGFIVIHVSAMQYGEGRDLRHRALTGALLAIAVGLQAAGFVVTRRHDRSTRAG